jgi:SAM-dependent methyltransferase
MSEDKKLETVSDFNKQWISFQKQKGVYADESFFFDYFGSLLDKSTIKDKTVAEIGCGNGRFVKIMSHYAREVGGFEPSGAIDVAKKYCQDRHNINFYQQSIYDVDKEDKYDAVFCLGVLHHLPDPLGALQKMSVMLKNGGECYVWVYGSENNSLYLKIFKPLIKITSRFPHWLLNTLSFILAILLKIYIVLVSLFRFLPWPMKTYVLKVLNKLGFYYLKLVIYDQLNPKIANYYSKEEICSLIEEAGFDDIEAYHRHNYSWTIKGLKK